MVRSNKKVLYALIVAYKNGLINLRPLKRWVDKQYIFQYVLKYFIYSIVFLYLLILLNEGNIIDLNMTTIIGHYQLETYRIFNGMLIIPLIISLYKIGYYLDKVIYVQKMMKSYSYSEGDIEVLDRVTFKVKPKNHK